MPWHLPQALAFEQRTGWSPAPHSLVSGSQFAWPANSSSLLFSCTGVNSLVHLAFDRLSKCVFSDFMEGHAVHGNFFHAAVIQLVAFAQKVGSRLRIGDYGDHSARRADDTVQPQRANLQSCFARRQRTRLAAGLLMADQ